LPSEMLDSTRQAMSALSIHVSCVWRMLWLFLVNFYLEYCNKTLPFFLERKSDNSPGCQVVCCFLFLFLWMRMQSYIKSHCFIISVHLLRLSQSQQQNKVHNMSDGMKGNKILLIQGLSNKNQMWVVWS
jgi:hypothetical protein